MLVPRFHRAVDGGRGVVIIISLYLPVGSAQYRAGIYIRCASAEARCQLLAPYNKLTRSSFQGQQEESRLMGECGISACQGLPSGSPILIPNIVHGH